MTTTAILGWALGMQEMIVLAIFGLLVFGKRLPEVGKSLGKSIVEFKKGLHGIEDEVNAASNTPELPPPRQVQTAPPQTVQTAPPQPVQTAQPTTPPADHNQTA